MLYLVSCLYIALFYYCIVLLCRYAVYTEVGRSIYPTIVATTAVVVVAIVVITILVAVAVVDVSLVVN